MNLWKNRSKPSEWIVIKTTIHGYPIAYFQWNHKTIWKWTKTADNACVFRSEQQAVEAVRSTSADWEAIWEPIKLST